MRALDRLIPTPRQLEINDIEIAAPVSQVWNLIRHSDLDRSLVTHAFFLLRSLPSQLAGRSVTDAGICMDDMVSTPENPGFQVLSDDPPHEVAVGAIGKVWLAESRFVHVADEGEFTSFSLRDFVKIAWALRLDVLTEERTRLSLELRVAADDEDTWVKFRRYFLANGPFWGSMRIAALKAIASEIGTVVAHAAVVLPGDETPPDTTTKTKQIVIRPPPEEFWSWLVQMGVFQQE